MESQLGLEETKNKKEKEKKEKQPSISFYQLFRFATPFELLLILIASIFAVGIGCMLPVSIIVLGDMFARISVSMVDGDLSKISDTILPLVLTFVYMGVAILIASYGANCLWILTGEYQSRRIRTLYLHAILRQDMSWFDKAEEGSLNTRLATDTYLIQEGISEKFGTVLSSVGQFVAGFVIAFINGWKLALIILAATPAISVSGGCMDHFMTKYTLKSLDDYAKAGAIAEQVFSGIRTIYSFSLQKRFTSLYEEKLKLAERSGILRGRSFGIGLGFFFFTFFGMYGLTFWYSGVLNRENSMTIDQILITFFAMIYGVQSLSSIPTGLSAVFSACGAAYKVFATIDRVPEIDPDNKQGITKERITGEIEFKNIQFAYPTRPDIPILKNLSLKIKAGMTVAFVGPSGSGKSTTIQLIQRFYNPLEGTLYVDNYDIKDYSVGWLRSQIGVVSQEPVLFNMSIKQNLLMGTFEEVNNDQIVEACKMANCHSFISQLPDGYETLVGEHGGMLSGGQKQRIAIARAIIKNPSILLLDEATSALDTQSERLVQAALDSASKNRTTIVIAHRLSTIRNADLIVVMNQGDLIEQGTHNELLDLNAVYADLVRKQEIKTKKEKSDDDELDYEQLLKREQEELKADKSEQSKGQNDEQNTTDLFKTASHKSMDAFDLKIRQDKEEKELAKLSSSPLKKVVMRMGPEKRFLLMGLAGAILVGVAFPVNAYVFATTIITLMDPPIEPPGPLEGANLNAFLFLIIAIGTFLGFSMQIVGFETAGERFTMRFRTEIFSSLMKQEIGYFDNPENSLGALTSKLALDSKKVNDMVTKVWGDCAQIFIVVIAGLTIAFIQSWILTLIILLTSPFMAFAFYFEAQSYTEFEDKTKTANEKSGEVAGEAIKEIRTVAGLNKQSYFECKYAKATDRPHHLAKVKAYKSSIGYSLMKSITILTMAIAFYAGTRLMQDDKITFSEMFKCLMAVMITAEMIGRCSVFVRMYTTAKFSAIASFNIIDRQPLIDPDYEGIEPTREQITGDVSFKNIVFRYPSRPNVSIFNGEFDLEGKAGKTIALVGPSGCGKSTTIGMLQRWYDPESGTIRIDDNNVKTFQLRNLRSHMALVGQEPVLFDMTIGENIRFGVDDDKTITQEEVEKAAKAANIHKFISSLPEGYNTRVGDKGSQLSGGQKQRIAIARALIRKPKILLLDEATSALDSESEKLVQSAIDNILEEGGRTTITIAHRLSTIQNSNLICVVKDGKVVEQGTHWELLKLDGVYSKLVYQQSLNAH
ncbi:putative ABC transporter protein [Pilobolus umbonatus]|nr:putative ABC transporter protein [Pilobolus umbonatus]